jgi:hypothetical protein
VQTNNVSPEYGRFAGGVLLMATKSGSNQFHGALYEYARNAALNANLWFNNHNGVARPQWTQNQYGATLGGPIIRDKAFAFLSWEQFDLRQGVTTTATMPTTAQLGGTFGTTPLFNRKNPTCAASGTGSGSSPCLFPTNAAGNYFIPAAYQSGTALAMIPHIYLTPNAIGSVGYNFIHQALSPVDYNNYNIRGDQNIGTKHRLFERYTEYHLNYGFYSATGNEFWYPQGNDSKQAVIGDTITLSSTMVADVRASLLRYKYNRAQVNCCNYNMSQFGSGWASIATGIVDKQLPSLSMSQGYYGPGGPDINDTDNAYVLSGNFTWIKGRHTISFGGEARKIEWDYTQTNIPSGQFFFDQTGTQGAGKTGGDTFASFMVGLPYKGQFIEPKLSKGVMWYSGLYLGDSFRMSPRLTINAGVRWERPGSFTETHGSLVTLKTDLPTSLTMSGQPLTGGLALINSPQWQNKNWQDQSWKLFSPRLGLAYSPNQKTTISSGFGISYLPAVVAFSAGPYNVPTNQGTTNLSTFSNSANGNDTLDNPAAGGLVLPGGNSQAALDLLVGNGIQAMVPNQTYPYQMQWNAGVQHQFGNSMSLQVSYVGAKGNHLPLYSVNLDQLPDQYDVCGYDSTQPQCGGHLLTDSVTNPMSTANGGFIAPDAATGKALNKPWSSTLGSQKISYGYLLKPHPQYLYMTALAPSIGETTYAALQVYAKKQFGSNGVMTASYTKASLKGTADVLSPWLEANNRNVGGGQGVQDNTNIKGNATNPGEYSQSSFNTPQRLVVNYVYPLPFGHGAKYLANSNRVVDTLISKWTVNGVSTFQGGFPLAMVDTNTNALQANYAAGNAGGGTGAGATRPNYVAGCDRLAGIAGKPSQRVVAGAWFNTACLPDVKGAGATNSTYSFGNEPRVDPVLHAQGIDSSDFSVMKAISFREKYNVELRTEFFNVFNWTQFAPPSTSADAGANYGKVTAQYNQPRLVQFSGRFTF